MADDLQDDGAGDGGRVQTSRQRSKKMLERLALPHIVPIVQPECPPTKRRNRYASDILGGPRVNFHKMKKEKDSEKAKETKKDSGAQPPRPAGTLLPDIRENDGPTGRKLEDKLLEQEASPGTQPKTEHGATGRPNRMSLVVDGEGIAPMPVSIEERVLKRTAELEAEETRPYTKRSRFPYNQYPATLNGVHDNEEEEVQTKKSKNKGKKKQKQRKQQQQQEEEQKRKSDEEQQKEEGQPKQQQQPDDYHYAKTSVDRSAPGYKPYHLRSKQRRKR